MKISAVCPILLCGYGLLQGGSATPVPFSQSDAAVPGHSLSGEILLQSRCLQVDLEFSRDRTERGDLTIVFAADTGYYLWHYAPVIPGSDVTCQYSSTYQTGESVAYVLQDRLINFHLPGALYIAEWRNRANSLDHAQESAIKALKECLSKHDGRAFGDEAKPVLLPISTDPSTVSSPIAPQRRLIQVDKMDSGWKLIVQEFTRQTFYLDENYNVIQRPNKF